MISTQVLSACQATPAEIHAIGLARYGTPRFLAAMSRDTGIAYRTLHRYAREGTCKPMVVRSIRGLMLPSSGQLSG